MRKRVLSKNYLRLLLTSVLCSPLLNVYAQDATLVGPVTLTEHAPYSIDVKDYSLMIAQDGNIAIEAPSINMESTPSKYSSVFVFPDKTLNLHATSGNIEGNFTGAAGAPSLLYRPGSNIIMTADKGDVTLIRNGTSPHYLFCGGPIDQVDATATTPSKLNLTAENIHLETIGYVFSNKVKIGRFYYYAPSEVSILSHQSNTFTAEIPLFNASILQFDKKSTGSITAESGDNTFNLISKGSSNSILALQNSKVTVTAPNGSNNLTGTSEGSTSSDANAIIATNTASLLLSANKNIITTDRGYTLYANDNSDVTIQADQQNILTGYNTGSLTLFQKMADATALINARTNSTVNLVAEDTNTLSTTLEDTGALRAQEDSSITVSAKTNTLTTGGETVFSNEKGNIQIIGSNNTILSKAQTTRAAVVAADEANIAISGSTNITSAGANGVLSTTKGNIILNDLHAIDTPHMALRAGQTTKPSLDKTVSGSTEEELKENPLYTGETIEKEPENPDYILAEPYYFIDETPINTLLDNNQASITAQYTKEATLSAPVLADAGTLTLTPKDAEASITHTSQSAVLLAVNTGTVNYTLSKGSTLTGFAYNFMDLGTPTQDARETKVQDEFKYAEPESSTKAVIKTTDYVGAENPNSIFALRSGHINLTLDKEARWNNTQQSAITSLAGEGTVAVSEESNRTMGNALHIDTLKGNNTFQMHLEKVDNANHSDMLYIKNGKESQNLLISNADTLFDSMKQGDYVRVATITNATNNEFGADKKVYYQNTKGLLSTTIMGTYSHNALSQDTDESYNNAYNGSEWTNGKPGNDFVSFHYGAPDAVTNYYLFCEQVASPAAQAIPATYNAAYGLISQLDTLNKRQGEIRYEEGNTGWWARSIQTDLNKHNAYNLSGHAFELGYDTTVATQTTSDFVRSKGLFIHYGAYNGESTENTKTHQDFKLLALGAHQTARKTNGSYYDLVARIGQLRSDYHTSTPSVTGRYTQGLLQLSAEVGRQYMRNQWTLEPQVQLQYTYLGGTSYRDSDDSQIRMHHLNSLIGRLGVRVTRNLSTVRDEVAYGYCNVEHDFLGTRNTSAYDEQTTINTQTRDGSTWFTAGLGYSRPINKNLFANANIEKRFGSGYHGTRYDIRVEYKF